MRRRLYRRAWWVGHSRDGFHLAILDRRLGTVLAEAAVHGILAALGHPCCGRDEDANEDPEEKEEAL